VLEAGRALRFLAPIGRYIMDGAKPRGDGQWQIANAPYALWQ